MTPKQIVMLLWEYRVKWLGAGIGKRTTVQIECPHIISIRFPTEDVELETDHSCGMVLKLARSGAIGHNAGPLSRFWSAKL
jgi:hypothetical protein